ncbi:hypothetical protein GQ53DRAFT_807913 [Thozetella sp. PMI_491]|nr:hypothetical protein GQ53DRAFT_807913 [Thozetella sp. PMI_491]
MDDAGGLVSELEHRLRELNDKVAAYQRELVAEFEKHMQDRLSACPDHVAAQVSRAIAESMSSFPALRTLHDSSPPTPTLADRASWDGRRSPPPILYHTSGTPRDGLRAPHEREEEFHGLFTPSYLPLLDGSDRAMQSLPTSPAPASLPLPPPPPLPSLPPSLPPSLLPSLSADSADHAAAPKPPARDLRPEPRPTPIRRLTDRSSSSVDSSSSEARMRRSALRRTSSSTKGSPRRVRFEFQGMEVLPNSSPQASVILGRPSEAEAQADTSAIAEEDESQDYTGTSLLDVDGEEDALPRPKKVSSTQALRALSQQPLDAGTVWTVVNAEPEETAKMNGPDDFIVQTGAVALVQQNAAGAVERKPSASYSPPRKTSGRRLQFVEQPGSPGEAVDPDEDDEDDEVEFLSMGLKSPIKPAPLASGSRASASAAIPDLTSSDTPAPSGPGATKKEATDAHQSNSANVGNDEDEPMFEFEEEDSRSQKRGHDAPRKYIEEEETEPTPQAAIGDGAPLTTTAAAGSLPVRRPQPALPFLAQSVGSYKGTSLNFAPISNPGLYEEIANMKDVPLLFGSIDDVDMTNYRATLAHLSGEPKSFSERLAFEEMMEQKKAEEADRQDGAEKQTRRSGSD